MSAIATPSQPVSTGDPGATPVSPEEIDASCRWPVLLLFVFAVLWLLADSAFALIATLKFHQPKILADCPWFTYGRVHPAQINSFVYGFAAQAGLGTLLWLVARLGRTRLAFPFGIILGTVIWNIGLKLGILGILFGESTGFAWLELPRYASVLLFTGYLLIGVGAMLTLKQRADRRLDISQWFLLAAILWFPWIYSTAGFLLVAKTVRGSFQMVVDSWYVGNLTTVWMGFIGLAAIFYFISKAAKRPLHSQYLGIFTFWTLAMFGSWGIVPVGSPLPSWIPALSTATTVLTLVPVIAVAINVRRTVAGEWSLLAHDAPTRFLLFSAVTYVLAGVLTAVGSFDHISEHLNFTWFLPARTQLFVYGFFAMAMFGAIYYIVPRLVGAELSRGLMGAHFGLAAFGLVFYFVPLALGGMSQGAAMNLHNVPFLNVMQATLPYLRAGTLGDLAMALGHLLLVLNLAALFARIGRACLTTALAGNVKTAEVTP